MIRNGNSNFMMFMKPFSTVRPLGDWGLPINATPSHYTHYQVGWRALDSPLNFFFCATLVVGLAHKNFLQRCCRCRLRRLNNSFTLWFSYAVSELEKHQFLWVNHHVYHLFLWSMFHIAMLNNRRASSIIWATVKTPAILNMYSTDIGLWKLMELVKNTR